MLGRQPAAVLGDQHLALGDADQRVMRGIIVGLGEIRLVGGDQRHFEAVGEFDQALLGLAFVGRAVALQLDVEAVAEQRLEPLDLLGGEAALPGQQRVVDGPARAAGEADQAPRHAPQR